MLRAPDQTAAVGRITRFTLKFPHKLTERLKAMPRKQKLTLRLTATAANAVGELSTSTTTAKLKGEAKAQRKGNSRPQPK